MRAKPHSDEITLAASPQEFKAATIESLIEIPTTTLAHRRIIRLSETRKSRHLIPLREENSRSKIGWRILVQTPLNASANSAGSLLSTRTFEVPQFQREYAWGTDEVGEFWADLRNSLNADSYFLGLIILTEGDRRMHVVDGQQRLLTLTLLANALHHEAKRHGRTSLAERIQADFLRSIDYDTDETNPRICLSDENDNSTLSKVLEEGDIDLPKSDVDSVSLRILQSNNYIFRNLRKDLSTDPFKRLGAWTDFITNRLYFAVFVHPDPASAYQVYEVINTRGKDLTTAHLLKNYILSQTAVNLRQERYDEWAIMHLTTPESRHSRAA